MSKSIEMVTTKTSEYSIQIQNDFNSLKEHLLPFLSEKTKICIVTDTNVAPLYMEQIKNEVFQDWQVISYMMEAGEKSKCQKNANELYQILITNNYHRNDILIALGGGVVGDLTGYVAATYLRGIPFVQIPTTLLSMVDSSIGGKTAVDYEQYKNMIGSFYMPSLVYINTMTLTTLPEREYYAGFAEIMKAALLADSHFYEWLIENMYEIFDKEEDTLIEMLEQSIQIKKKIVDKDPFEAGDRALLNLGHTIGHAIEKTMNFEYLHGECVALGCVAAAFISWKMNFIPMEEYYEIRDMFVPFNLPISIETKCEDEIFEALTHDKKLTNNAFRMILLKKIGKAFICEDVPVQIIKDAIHELNFEDKENE